MAAAGVEARPVSDSGSEKLQETVKPVPELNLRRSRRIKYQEDENESDGDPDFNHKDFEWLYVLPKKPRTKKFLEEGLFADSEVDASAGFQFSLPPASQLEALTTKKDFKLPCNIYQPMYPLRSVNDWKTVQKNAWTRDAHQIYEKVREHIPMCCCLSDCGEDCLNRVSYIECDSSCCPLPMCSNRAFQKQSKLPPPFIPTPEQPKYPGGRLLYARGYEVFATGPKGFGLRATRDYEPRELILEYTGEVISNDEMEHRMSTIYANTRKYYCLSFVNGLVIDSGRRGSEARYVNHSCNPNSEMQKWYVKGTPRIGLFAGDDPIPAGTEFTYDYNFDIFKGTIGQKCYCGEPRCRGIIGKRSEKELQPPIKLRISLKSSSGTRRRRITLEREPIVQLSRAERAALRALKEPVTLKNLPTRRRVQREEKDDEDEVPKLPVVKRQKRRKPVAAIQARIRYARARAGRSGSRAETPMKLNRRNALPKLTPETTDDASVDLSRPRLRARKQIETDPEPPTLSRAERAAIRAQKEPITYKNIPKKSYKFVARRVNKTVEAPTVAQDEPSSVKTVILEEVQPPSTPDKAPHNISRAQRAAARALKEPITLKNMPRKKRARRKQIPLADQEQTLELEAFQSLPMVESPDSSVSSAYHTYEEDNHIPSSHTSAQESEVEVEFEDDGENRRFSRKRSLPEDESDKATSANGDNTNGNGVNYSSGQGNQNTAGGGDSSDDGDSGIDKDAEEISEDEISESEDEKDDDGNDADDYQPTRGDSLAVTVNPKRRRLVKRKKITDAWESSDDSSVGISANRPSRRKRSGGDDEVPERRRGRNAIDDDYYEPEQVSELERQQFLEDEVSVGNKLKESLIDAPAEEETEMKESGASIPAPVLPLKPAQPTQDEHDEDDNDSSNDDNAPPELPPKGEYQGITSFNRTKYVDRHVYAGQRLSDSITGNKEQRTPELVSSVAAVPPAPVQTIQGPVQHVPIMHPAIHQAHMANMHTQKATILNANGEPVQISIKGATTIPARVAPALNYTPRRHVVSPRNSQRMEVRLPPNHDSTSNNNNSNSQSSAPSSANVSAAPTPAPMAHTPVQPQPQPTSEPIATPSQATASPAMQMPYMMMNPYNMSGPMIMPQVTQMQMGYGGMPQLQQAPQHITTSQGAYVVMQQPMVMSAGNVQRSQMVQMPQFMPQQQMPPPVMYAAHGPENQVMFQANMASQPYSQLAQPQVQVAYGQVGTHQPFVLPQGGQVVFQSSHQPGSALQQGMTMQQHQLQPQQVYQQLSQQQQQQQVQQMQNQTYLSQQHQGFQAAVSQNSQLVQQMTPQVSQPGTQPMQQQQLSTQQQLSQVPQGMQVQQQQQQQQQQIQQQQAQAAQQSNHQSQPVQQQAAHTSQVHPQTPQPASQQGSDAHQLNQQPQDTVSALQQATQTPKTPSQAPEVPQQAPQAVVQPAPTEGHADPQPGQGQHNGLSAPAPAVTGGDSETAQIARAEPAQPPAERQNIPSTSDQQLLTPTTTPQPAQRQSA